MSSANLHVKSPMQTAWGKIHNMNSLLRHANSISRKKDKSEQSYLGVKMTKKDFLTLDDNGGRLLNGCRASRDRL